MNTRTLTLVGHRALRVARTLGGVTLLSTVTLTPCVQQVAAADHAMPMDHSHCAAMAAAAANASYKHSLQTYAPIPDVVLTDAEGNPVRVRELLAGGEPVMLNFIFTTCTTICPVITKVFEDVRAKLGPEADNLRMVSISIDPDNDTPARLKAYAQKYGADSHWTFLTGSVQDVASVQSAVAAYDSDKMNHQPLTLLRTAPGDQWLRIDGFATPDQLVSEYRTALAQVDAGHDHVGL